MPRVALMGFWRNVFGLPTATVGVKSPYAPSDTLVEFASAEILGDISKAGGVTREIALRVPGVKRAHGIHCATVAGLSFYLMDGDVRAAEQPKWLTNSESGVSPYHRMYGVTSDLFMTGWACLGFTADKSDALHIPAGLWGVDGTTGEAVISETIPAKYRALPVFFPLGYGSNGLLVDGIDSVRAARAIDAAWINRIENPIPMTNLHIDDPAYDQLSKKAKLKIVDEWNENRRRAGGATAITQSFIKVEDLGSGSAHQFE
jgi:hypothetical protein